MTAPEGTIVFLPGLGLDASAAAPLASALGDRFRVVGIDLPGQGSAPDAPDASVSALADAAVAAIEVQGDGGPWMLVAHSMGGKVAALVIDRVLTGRARVFGLAGAVLLAPSPPTPEPMTDDKRAQMLAWSESGALSEAHAREFVAQNVAAPLADEAAQDAVSQVRRTSPLAWRRWLTDGSREDVSSAVGTIDLPVVVLSGEDDVDLGASAQPGLVEPVYPRARFVRLAGTGHLLPCERPAEVAREIERLWAATVSVSPQVSAEWGRVIGSDRTAVEARCLLARRLIADDPEYAPRALSPAQLGTLRALADRLVPQPGERRVDLAARVDADLARGRGDGWRPAGLPVDAAAYRLGLDEIAAFLRGGAGWDGGGGKDGSGGRDGGNDAGGDGTAPGAALDDLIRRVIAGEADSVGGPLSGELLRRWFEDARNDLVRAWLAHPASLARIGYDGFATSGEAEPSGYVELGAGRRDPWEPAELGALASDQPGDTRRPDRPGAAPTADRTDGTDPQ